MWLQVVLLCPLHLRKHGFVCAKESLIPQQLGPIKGPFVFGAAARAPVESFLVIVLPGPSLLTTGGKWIIGLLALG